MRIGIDLQVLGQKPWTGVGNYAFRLMEALLKLDTEHEWVLFTPSSSPPYKGGERVGVRVVTLPPKKIPFWTSHVTYARIMREARLDVLHGPANVFPLRITNQYEYTNTKFVLTVHDLAIYKHPEWFPRGQWFSTKFLVPRSIKKADAIIVPSQTTANDLQELLHVPEEKIQVIPLGVGEEYFKISNSQFSISNEFASNNFQKKYILFVGTLEPRKNVGRLIEAYEGLPEEIKREYDLVIAGSTPSYSPPTKAGGEKGAGFSPSRREGGDGVGVRWLGFVPDENLPPLYQNASLFVYPSLYEGFGLPVLEAMAAGVPVVTSRGVAENIEVTSSSPARLASPARQIVVSGGRVEAGGSPPYKGGERVGVVDPYSVEEIRDAMARVLTDQNLAREMRERGARIAKEFTWERTAQETLKVYEKTQNPNVQ